MTRPTTRWGGAWIDGGTARSTLVLTAICAAVLFLAGIPATRAEARPGIKDRDITSAIETDLLINDQVPSQNVDVLTKDGIVTLSGSVYNILARDKATEIAESIKGVRSVINEITVKPVLRSDDEIQRDVREALLADPATDGYDLSVKVTGGQVSLSGKVDSYGERRLCSEVAESVRGVRGITNHIDVDYRSNRPDTAIAEEVEALLRDDVRIDNRLIAVKVKDGRVSLSGTVRSAAERTWAEQKAWVGGVHSVEDSGLEVEWLAPDSMQRESTYTSMTDEEIEKAVHDALLQDPRVLSFDVGVHSDYGVVTLDGTVDNLKASKAAEEDAGNTAGAWRVKNHLKVRPATYLSDEQITTRVNIALKRDPYLDRHEIHVSTYNGKAYLSGTVDSEFEKLEAEDAAYRVNGVIAVGDYLNVRRTPPRKSDLEIRYSVEDQLFWDPSVNSEQVEVSVQNGVATLTGSVRNWYEYSQAAEDAFRGGARELKNELHMVHAPRAYGSR